ncbi:MAG TPA: protein kinase [Kofleriaceae bacterium]|nr:protein kinase [Kofleriaceae bacterium]
MASEPQLGDGAALGGHEVLYQIKAGGMGEVLLARRVGPSGFERLVALKIIRSELRDHDPLRRMFLDEAQLLARVSHPAIAQIYDFGEDGGVLYLAMEYVTGVSFRDLVGLSPPPAVSARAMAEVCRALHAAHELTDLAGNPLVVVHRDVSPDNLMLTFDGQVKVLDFGIALMRGRQAPVTEYGTIKGKPPYLSPEQIKNLPVDRRTDVFAASAVLHELLTGRQVFDGESVYAIAHAIQHQEIAPPSTVAGPLPPGLDAAVMVGLERDPERRWQTAELLARALDEVVAAAGGESLAEYAARQLADEHRRHRAWLRAVLEKRGTASRRAGRDSGVVTARGGDFDSDGPTLDGTPLPGRARRRALVAIAGAAVVGGGLAAWGVARAPSVAPARAIAGDRAVAAGVQPDRAAGPGEQPDRAGGSREPPDRAGGSGDQPDRARPAGEQPALAIGGPAAPAPMVASLAGPDAALAPGDREPVAPARRKATGRARPRPAARTGGHPTAPPPPSPASAPGTAPAAAADGATDGAAAEPVGEGTITLRTRPGTAWAKLRIDGKDAGVTPQKRGIPAGTHDIEFVHPDSEGVRYQRRVHVVAGHHVEVVAP